MNRGALALACALAAVLVGWGLAAFLHVAGGWQVRRVTWGVGIRGA